MRNGILTSHPEAITGGSGAAGPGAEAVMSRPAARLRLVLVLLLAFAFAAASGPMAQAAQLVMFDSKYCPWCLRWKREIGVIYDKTEEGRKAPLRIVDRDDPRPDDLKHIKGIYWTPTFVLLDDEGREVGRIEGYQYEGAFWSQLGELLRKLEARRTTGTGKIAPARPAEKEKGMRPPGADKS